MQVNRKNIIKSIQESTSRSLAEKKSHYFNKGINFIINNPLPKNVDINKVMSLLKKNLPTDCYKGINNVYIGQFDKLKKRDLTAMLYNNNLYVDNNVESEKDLIDDLVHEFAHSYEENNSEAIYEDGKIINEFLGKRNRLHDLLVQENIPDLNYFDFLNLEHDKQFDDFLYKTVGYQLIRNVAPTLFIRPYAATSLREYFATGFEDYYLTGGEELKNISPILYEKISSIEKSEKFKFM